MGQSPNQDVTVTVTTAPPATCRQQHSAAQAQTPDLVDNHKTISPTYEATSAFETMETPRTATHGRASIDVTSGHARSMSAADTARRAKRFTMTFPINATATDASRLPSPIRTAAPSALPDSLASPTGPSDSGFLTAIAAQERRVLELKEELHKAEGELKRLKQEWTLHEAQRKRHDIRKLQKLQPLHTPLPSRLSLEDDDTDGSSAWMQQEMERRKALLSGTRQSSRTVFSGSRHARTLSLLSPTGPSLRPAVPRAGRVRSRSPTAPERPSQPLRLPTDDVLATEMPDTADTNIDLGLPRDVLMKTGKQMANDFRDGLWTFIEDLRQATVGEEGVNGTTTRTLSSQHMSTEQRSLQKQPNRGSLRAPPRPQPLKRSSTTGNKRSQGPSPAPYNTIDDSALLDLGGSFWRENGVAETRIEERPVTKKAHKKKLETPRQDSHVPKDSFDGWDTWDSPESKSKTGRSNSDTSGSDIRTSPSPNGTSPRTSTSSYRDGPHASSSQHGRTQRDSLPWPAISKLTPSSLRRTASNLMADWEKSVTPPGDEKAGEADYVGRAVSPATSLASSVKDRKSE